MLIVFLIGLIGLFIIWWTRESIGVRRKLAFAAGVMLILVSISLFLSVIIIGDPAPPTREYTQEDLRAVSEAACIKRSGKRC